MCRSATRNSYAIDSAEAGQYPHSNTRIPVSRPPGRFVTPIWSLPKSRKTSATRLRHRKARCSATFYKSVFFNALVPTSMRRHRPPQVIFHPYAKTRYCAHPVGIDGFLQRTQIAHIEGLQECPSAPRTDARQREQVAQSKRNFPSQRIERLALPCRNEFANFQCKVSGDVWQFIGMAPLSFGVLTVADLREEINKNEPIAICVQHIAQLTIPSIRFPSGRKHWTDPQKIHR